MITPSTQNKLFRSEVKEFMKDRGFKYATPYEIEFSKNIECGLLRISVYFPKSGSSSNSLFRINYEAVESIIIHKVGLPNNTLESYRTGENTLFTVKDSSIFNPYSGVFKIGDPNNKLLKTIESEKDLMDFTNFFKNYVTHQGNSFVEKYSYMPNALEKINELEFNADKYYSKYICGGSDKLFRVLLISKLCNDPHFEKKKERMDARFNEPNKEKWKPYYFRLCVQLEKIVPLY